MYSNKSYTQSARLQHYQNLNTTTTTTTSTTTSTSTSTTTTTTSTSTTTTQQSESTVRNYGTNNKNGYNSNGKSQLNTSTGNNGNYINVVPLPIGVPYHRRKLTPQDYQSRLYYNNNDFRCRDDFYSIASGTSRSIASGTNRAITSSAGNTNRSNGVASPCRDDFYSIASTTSRATASGTTSRAIASGTNRANVIASPLPALSTSNRHQQIDDKNSNNRRVVATQTNTSELVTTNGNNLVNNSTSSGGCNTPVQPPVLYTVHRVVTTAHLQTSGGNTFATSSSVSSVVSAVRNEADYGLTSNTGLINTPGLSTNTTYQQPHTTPCNTEIRPSCNQEVRPSSSISNNFNSTSTSTNYSSGSKPSASIPRALQNVIPTCVYLMSRIAVHMEIEGTAQCPAQVMLAAALGCEELGIANKLLAQSIFGLWMTSALLEIQLKSQHRPYVVRVAWPNLLDKFSHGNPIEKRFDEPMIVLKRNVFFSKKDEEKIKDHRIVELLYEEAKSNVLAGRYIMEPVHSIMLGGIQARIELGPYNSHTHTISFFRENQSRFLPQHVAKNSSWSWLPISRKTSAEVRLLEQYKRVPQTATTRKLMRKYLEFCWALPFYGASFFHGQVEQPVSGLMSLVSHKDISVLVGINERGIYIIDPVECTLLLGLRYEDLSWDYAKPSSNDSDGQTCIFLQFDAVENGIQVTKLMQIFSRQAAMMDALISHFADLMRHKREGVDGQPIEHSHDEPNPIQSSGNGVLCNKLSRLTLSTFDDEGRCIGQMGSLSISY